jgi:hypothetical protein
MPTTAREDTRTILGLGLSSWARARLRLRLGFRVHNRFLDLPSSHTPPPFQLSKYNLLPFMTCLPQARLRLRLGLCLKAHNRVLNLPSSHTPPPFQLPKYNHLPFLTCPPRPPSPMQKINHIPRLIHNKHMLHFRAEKSSPLESKDVVTITNGGLFLLLGPTTPTNSSVSFSLTLSRL